VCFARTTDPEKTMSRRFRNHAGAAKAFLSEVETGSRKENASK
jgi:hypothetical protein